ncbi:YceI family protein [Hufsiella ginkgonis]|uniref:YceI family protein n=1 Tax=Hufsiella ginkgonis TaxID=2695274 RepID=A0A7K1XYM4_9SPHI|nr:YceI family protein [Hufsiella ginkgonis]MXV16095.1 YceI family protein [Hufsiella ginkgonis]
MKTSGLLLCLFFALGAHAQGTVYTSKEIKSRIYSEAPMENIEAVSAKGISVLNAATGEIQVTIPIRSFQFKKSLMQEHFNENYLESDKYPNAVFKGRINGPLTLTDGEYKVTVTGDLDVHGVKQQRTISGTIRISKGVVSINSVFMVMCKDHNIKIPTLVFKNIAESIQVSISGNYTIYSAPKP